MARISCTGNRAQMPLIEKIVLFVEPTALAFLLVYAYGYFSRSVGTLRTLNMIMGGIFGISAVVAMLDPIPLAEGVIVDMRNLFVGMAAAYFGFVRGLIAVALGGIARVIIGGDGVGLGIMGMTTAAGMGVIWAYWVRPRMQSDVMAFLTLGGMVSAHILVGLLLPSPIRETFFFNLAPTLVIANLIGALILSKLIERERGLLDERNQLHSAASYDALTQLMNRQTAVAAYDAMPKTDAETQGTAMLCIDVDYFKTINDTHGHLVGDQILIGIARRMSDCLRPKDIFARMSGDEFVIVLHDLMADQARAVADRCRHSISAEPMIVNGVEINASVSIGCTWVSDRPGFAAFRHAADEALYRAKDKGRNCMAFDKAQAVLTSGGQTITVAA